jgi:thiamine phosphate synthase YjbQ (UPF0047 family)
MLSSRLSAVTAIAPELMSSATLAVPTRGRGFFEITKDVQEFVAHSGAGDGILFMFVRHTSASLVIQENADPDVRTDLGAALERLVKTMLTGVSLHVPVRAGALDLGTWQGIYLAEHRARPHHRQVALHYIGARCRR